MSFLPQKVINTVSCIQRLPQTVTRNVFSKLHIFYATPFLSGNLMFWNAKLRGSASLPTRGLQRLGFKTCLRGCQTKQAVVTCEIN